MGDRAFFLGQIENGPNAILYEKLMENGEFTAEEVALGITPLFYGRRASQRIASAYFNGTVKQYHSRMLQLPFEGQETERVKESIRGDFTLPHTADDLVACADRWIQEYACLERAIGRCPALFAEGIREYPKAYRQIIAALESVKRRVLEMRVLGLLP